MDKKSASNGTAKGVVHMLHASTHLPVGITRLPNSRKIQYEQTHKHLTPRGDQEIQRSYNAENFSYHTNSKYLWSNGHVQEFAHFVCAASQSTQIQAAHSPTIAMHRHYNQNVPIFVVPTFLAQCCSL
jgi:hypothetical protein